MGRPSHRGQGPRSRGQAITRGHEGRGGGRQIGGPQHQVHRPNTGRPNGCRPSNDNQRCQYSDGRNPVHARVDAERRQVHARLGPVQRQGPVQRLGPVPPPGLIPNRKRKPTPSIASTSNATPGKPPKKKLSGN